MINEFEILPLSALEKVFPATRPVMYEDAGICFCNEVHSFQIAYRTVGTEMILRRCRWKVEGDLAPFVRVRPVAAVTATTAAVKGSDDYVLSQSAFAVPEILTEADDFYLRYREWGALFITVSANPVDLQTNKPADPDGQFINKETADGKYINNENGAGSPDDYNKANPAGVLPAGRHVITVSLFDDAGGLLGKICYTLTVCAAALPRGGLMYTNWFHYDSVAAYYGLRVFSPEYMPVMWRYVENAVSHGMNMLYVPLFTPPLNTYVGGERLTVQLVDVEVEDGEYSFDLDRLVAFMKTAEDKGVRYFEMSHLYTQWGAAHAPKIIARAGGEEKRIFGWEDDALGERYVAFITRFLTVLTRRLRQEGYGADRCFFHISDEPSERDLDHYLAIRRLVKPLLGDYRIFDALSNYGFYERGAVDVPVVATDSTDDFVRGGVKDLWVYYCTGQHFGWLSNRFMCMPTERIRIIGFQLWLNGCKGLLQWGYNYYNTALSERYIDPYKVNDAGGSFQSGDSFIVYPAPDGRPLDTVRHEAMRAAMQDYRLLVLLENRLGRGRVEEMLLSAGMAKDFSTYPKSALWYTGLKNRLAALAAEL